VRDYLSVLHEVIDDRGEPFLSFPHDVIDDRREPFLGDAKRSQPVFHEIPSVACAL
jgi:hypothetical protein